MDSGCAALCGDDIEVKSDAQWMCSDVPWRVIHRGATFICESCDVAHPMHALPMHAFICESSDVVHCENQVQHEEEDAKEHLPYAVRNSSHRCGVRGQAGEGDEKEDR